MTVRVNEPQLKIKRPVLRYHGGKFRSAPWIIAHMPPHNVYVEPYGGAASVLLRKPISFAEIYNELDSEISELFQVLRDPVKSKELVRLVELTSFSRSEYESAFERNGNMVENARKLICKYFMGYSSDSVTRNGKSGFRSIHMKSGRYCAADWENYPYHLAMAIKRLKRVLIENLPALDVIERYYGPNTLLYCDPPYIPSTRNIRNYDKSYRHEMTDEDHILLSDKLHTCQGMVIISGYPSELYDELYSGWQRHESSSRIHGGKRNGAKVVTEVIWLNKNCRGKINLPLFQERAANQ